MVNKLETAIIIGVMLVVVGLGCFVISDLSGPKSVEAQGSNTIYQQIFTQQATAPANSANVRNIGQSQHLLYVQTVNAPGKTCSATPPFNSTTVDAVLQGSFDNVTFFPMSAANTGNQFNINTSVIYVSGLAPYIRVHLYSFDATDCRLNAWYSGSLYPIFTDKLEVASGGQGLQIVYYNGSGTGSAIPVSSSGDGRQIAVYGMQCGASAAASLEVFDTGASTHVTFQAGDTSNIIIPPGSVPFFRVIPGGNLEILQAGTSNVSCAIQYRLEP